MKDKYLAILLSLLSGFLIAIMITLNASLGGRIGIIESTFIVHLVGALFGIIMMGLFFRENKMHKIGKTPKYLFFSGVLGVLIVLTANAVVPKLGMVLAVGLFLTGNLFFAVVVDHFGLLNLPVYKISWRRALGLVSAIIGLILVF